MSQKVLWKILLSNGTLNHWYAWVILLSKEWWSEEVVVLWSKCVDHVDWFFWRLPGLVFPPTPVVFSSWLLLSLRAGMMFVDDQEIARYDFWKKTSPFYPWLWNRSWHYPRRWWLFTVLRKDLPKIMGALTSPPVSRTTKSTGTYDCPTRTMDLQDSLGVAEWLIYKLQMHICV